MAEKEKNAVDLDLSPSDLLAKCLAQLDLASAIALHEKYYLHHHAQCGKPLADAKAKIDQHLAEIKKINASVAAVRNDDVQLAFADSNGREAIEKHFAARAAA